MIVVRNQNNINFTTVDNYFIKDINLSTKAKGLLIQLLALPDGWHISKGGIESIIKEGSSFVDTTLSELKKQGYVQIEKYRSKESGTYEYEYQIYAVPHFCEYLPDGQLINRRTNEVGRSNKYILPTEKDASEENVSKLVNSIKNLLKQERFFTGSLNQLKKFLPESLQVHNRKLMKLIRSAGNILSKDEIEIEIKRNKTGLVVLITKDYDKKMSKKKGVRSQIHSPLHTPVHTPEKKSVEVVYEPDPDFQGMAHTPMNKGSNGKVHEPDPGFQGMAHTPKSTLVHEPDPDLPGLEKRGLYKRMNNKKIDIRWIEKEIYQNMDLENLLRKFPDEKDQKLIMGMYEAIVDTLYLEQDKIRMGNDIYSMEIVQNRYRELQSEHIEYVLNNIKSLDHKIHNVDAYIKKSLFTAVRSLKVSDSTRKKDIEDFPEWYHDTEQIEPTPELLERVKQMQDEMLKKKQNGSRTGGENKDFRKQTWNQ